MTIIGLQHMPPLRMSIKSKQVLQYIFEFFFNVGGARDQERAGEAAARVDREEDEAEPGARQSGGTGDHSCGSIGVPGKEQDPIL